MTRREFLSGSAAGIILPATADNPETREEVNWFTQRNGQKVIVWESDTIQRGMAIDTIVVHEYANEPGTETNITPASHSALEYSPGRVYAEAWKTQTHNPDARGMPIQSGHFRLIGGVLTEVYYTYHKLIYTDGRAIDLLHDGSDPERPWEIGWHAKHWPTNCRSVAVCLVGKFEGIARPSDAQMKALAEIIRAWVDQFQKTGVNDNDIRIISHQQAAALGGFARGCPGPWFANGGQQELIRMAGLGDFLRDNPNAIVPHRDPLPQIVR